MFPLENYRCLKYNRSKAGLIIFFLGTGLAPPVCALGHGITNWSPQMHVSDPPPYIQQVKTFEQRHTIKGSRWMPMKQIRVLSFTDNLKNRQAETKPRVVWDIPNDCFIPSFPHRTVTLRPRMITEEFKGSFMGLPTQTRTGKSSIFYILRKMNSPFGILQGSMPI